MNASSLVALLLLASPTLPAQQTGIGIGTGNKAPTSIAAAGYPGTGTGEGVWVIDVNGNLTWDGPPADIQAYFGLGPGDIAVWGDWNGDGRTKIGVYNNGTWLLDYNGNGVWDSNDKTVYFGGPGYTPVVGDWNGSGTSKIGAYKDGTWMLDYNGNFTWDGPSVDKLAYFGGPGYLPVVGDWNGSGTSKIGAYLNGAWLLDKNGNFSWDGTPADVSTYFGGPNYLPVVGDWTGAGTTKIGAYSVDPAGGAGTWLVDYNGNFLWDGTSGTGTDKTAFFGGTGYTPVVGDWIRSGTTKIGAYQNGTWLLDHNGNFAWDGTGVDTLTFFGGTSQVPVVGRWTTTSPVTISPSSISGMAGQTGFTTQLAASGGVGGPYTWTPISYGGSRTHVDRRGRAPRDPSGGRVLFDRSERNGCGRNEQRESNHNPDRDGSGDIEGVHRARRARCCNREPLRVWLLAGLSWLDQAAGQSDVSANATWSTSATWPVSLPLGAISGPVDSLDC